MPLVIEKRNDILVKNHFEILPYDYNFPDQFLVILYYLDDYHCKIIVLRTDEDQKWDLNLKIMLYSEDDFEVINIGNSVTRSKKIIERYETKIKLEKSISENSIIPKEIIQTYEEFKFFSNLHKQAFNSIIYNNPEYRYTFYTSKDRREFLIKYFEPEIIECYDLLINGSFRADLFRYCYMYLNGGIYVDHKMVFFKPFNYIIKNDTEQINVRDPVNNYNCNGLIIIKPKSEVMKNCIELCCKHVRERFIGDCCLSVTGPGLYCKFVDKDKYETLYSNGWYFFEKKTDYVICENVYRNYYGEQFGGPDRNKVGWYRWTFNNGEVYYQNVIIKENIKFMVYPHRFSDTFNFCINGSKDDTVDNRQLIIYREDTNCKWDIELRIKIILLDEMLEKDIYVGPYLSLNNQTKFNEDYTFGFTINLKHIF